jgi:PhoH-like ATPase
MKKTYVLDTNVLLQNPEALFSFEDNKVVLTEAVLEELDNFKQKKDDLGVNARAVIRYLEKLRESGKLTEGVALNDFGGSLIVETNHVDEQLPPNWDTKKADNRIIQVCKALKDKGENVHLVTNDLMERIKGDISLVCSEGFESNRAPKLDQQYNGRIEVYVKDSDFAKFYDEKSLPIDTPLIEYDAETGEPIQFGEQLFANEFIILKNSQGNTALAKIDKQCRNIVKLNYEKYFPYGIKPRNVGQKFMIEALMSDCPLVILKGVAGTAKTLLSLAVGLDNITEKQEFRKILVCRPAIAMGGEDLGYLPGTEQEKIDPYMRPIYDNLEILVDSDPKQRYNSEEEMAGKVRYIMENDWIDMEACSFLRGRSISKQYIIIDEAQNLSQTQIKAIVTRAGEGTKIIIAGDPNQIDTPFLDTTNNGLSWLAEKMKGSSLCAQVTATDSECVRSKLAEEAIKRLD